MEQKIEVNNCYNIDCKIGMELMLEQGIKADWVITDPPYGIGADKKRAEAAKYKNGQAKAQNRDYGYFAWDSERIGGGTSI